MAVEIVEICAICALPFEGENCKAVLLAHATALAPRVLAHVGCNHQQTTKRARDGA